MKLVIQRVKKAKVTVDEKITGQIDIGLLVYIGFEIGDTFKDIEWSINKILNLRIFPDELGKLNLSVLEKEYKILIISQFTLLGNCKRGRRPSFEMALNPKEAKELYNVFLDRIKKSKIIVESGVFQAHMDVEYVNDGPITMVLDSKE